MYYSLDNKVVIHLLDDIHPHSPAFALQVLPLPPTSTYAIVDVGLGLVSDSHVAFYKRSML
jgi:hypothetical protein